MERDINQINVIPLVDVMRVKEGRMLDHEYSLL